MKSRIAMRLIATAIICAWLPTVPSWSASPPAALFQMPLNQIPVPEPPNLFQFVKNKPAAIKLGKALFWDMQAGSDGIQSCASCHFSAGTDNRLKNTVNPGTRAGDITFQVRGPNDTLQPGDFPFHQRQNPDFQDSPIIRDFNDVVGSQGVLLTDFGGITPGSAEDIGTPLTDQVFQAGGVNMRQVTARNTPSVINAVFNFNNFWDGRAHFIFNGVNPFGPQDTTAGVWFSDTAGNLTKQRIAIEMASLASQATGPPLDTTEMSFVGRTFPELGKKMLSLTPLGKQLVHPNDSVLGPHSRAVLQPDGKTTGSNGLSTSYEQMIKDAFHDIFWKSSVKVNLPTKANPGGEQFTQMEANFSMFWGLAIQLYEATLVSDNTPFDRLLGGDSTAIDNFPGAETGMNIFFGGGKCDVCHLGTELTSASATTAAFVTNQTNALIDQMPVASGIDTIYDIGYNATGVRPMVDDIGRGGPTPFTNPLTGLPIPLSFSAMAELQAVGRLPFASIVLPDQIPVNFPVSNKAAFKVPGLRNVELTGPFFHDGSVMSLEDMVDFYTRGGNFPSVAANPDLDFNITQIGTLQNSPDKMAAMVAFMKTLTDERVRNESAPFDHPELTIPNGHDANTGETVFIKIPAKGADGVAASTIALTLNAVSSPTRLTSQTISGTKDAGSSITISINGGSPSLADTVTDATWSTTLTGLVEGPNSITITAADSGGIPTTVTGSITVDRVAPALTINPVSSTTAVSTLTLSGTVEAGITPIILISSTATAGPVTAANGAWSTTITGLVRGVNSITVVAADPAGNVSFSTTSVTFGVADGNFKGTGTADISDALKALRISVGLITATSDDMLHGDVAPLDTVTGIPIGDNAINIADALTILRKVVGLISF
jgi:cytochrome c peroxidase